MRTGTRASLRGWDPLSGQVAEVSWRGDTITEVVRRGAVTADPPDDEPVLSPGLIDLQVNGFHGHDLNDGEVTPATVSALTDALARVGVTTWVPTIVTATEERIRHAVAQVARARADDERVACAVPFVHVEGPFISDQEGARGVHDPALVRPLDAAEVARWAGPQGLVGVTTVSPHTDEAPDQIRRIRGLGVTVALGHTHASSTQLRAAVGAGATLATHLGNGIPPLLPRHPNAIWTLLADDRVTAGIIADGHHLPDDVITVMVRAKTAGRAFLVSDSTALAGQPPGRYATSIGGQVDVSADGRLSFVGTELLAGAGRHLADGLRHLVDEVGVSWRDALQLTVSTPAHVVAQTRPDHGNRGRLAPGAPADLVLLDPHGDAPGRVDTVVAGGVRRL